jgi:uncharacterized protein
MHASMRTRTIAVLAAAATVAACLSAANPASAASVDVVISQVYGGGGNSGATFTNDFVELHNRGTAPVDLTGWSVQYASAAGTSWAVTPLSGSIAPGGFYLVQEGQGAGGTTPLPAPDATGTIAMSATNGKVALATSATPLPCGAACHGDAGVRDLVGYGTANDFEGAAPAPGLSNTTAALRGAGGLGADTDNNAADFTAGAPDPRNAGSSPPPPPPVARIHEIQGAAHRSPLVGTTVGEVPGIVTAVTARSFYFQDPEPDADPATSEGLQVFTSTRPTVAIGDRVLVTGRVSEFRGGNDNNTLTVTELTTPTVSIVERGVAVPAPVLLGPGGLVAPPAIRADAPGDVEAAPFDITANAMDFYESLEGMLVRVVDSVASGPTSGFGELSVLPGGAGGPRTVRGGIRYTYADPNTERVILDDVIAPVPAADTGDFLPGPVDGVLDYSFNNYKLLVLATPSIVDRGPVRESTRAQRRGELAIATYNVENLDPGDPVAKFDRLAAGIVTNLAAPDIVTLEEVQDNNGPTNDGTVAADQTLALLIDAIVRAGGPRYSFRSIDPVNLADGGEPGGNIRVAFLFRTDRGLSFVDRPGGDATTATDVVRAGPLRPELTLSPGRIDPANPAFANSRKPLVGEFRIHGNTVFVIANHFNSKGGDRALYGRFQPPVRASEEQRHAQAVAVRGFVDKIRAVNPFAAVVALGDLNDFEFSQTADILVGQGDLIDLPRVLPPAERYTYVFEGNSQVLDHILVSWPLALLGLQYDVVHINAEYSDQASDHDPQVVRFHL